MQLLSSIQRSLIQNYAKYAPRFTVIGEQYGHPVVELVDYPVTFRGGTRIELERVRKFRIAPDGTCWATTEWEPIDATGLHHVDIVFLNNYTKELI